LGGNVTSSGVVVGPSLPVAGVLPVLPVLPAPPAYVPLPTPLIK